jgi:hypothetical protein
MIPRISGPRVLVMVAFLDSDAHRAVCPPVAGGDATAHSYLIEVTPLLGNMDKASVRIAKAISGS